jgi:type VI secretion system secreted protein VgrG
MSSPTQANRPLKVTTPLGRDVLLLVEFTGSEAVSDLFTFQLGLIAENAKKIAFEKLIGQNITVQLGLPGGKERYFNGIINRFTQEGRDQFFTRYRAELVPQFWLWTRIVQSRIFQHLSIPDILKKVLTGLHVVYEIRGNYHPRDYCVQYRESDFDFANRLMEEEGIYYFFNHKDGVHEMVVTDVPNSHPDMPVQTSVIYDDVAGVRQEEMRITAWEKTQELRSGKYTLWDHCFELPGKSLDAQQLILDTVAVGQVTHKLRVGGNDKLEIYDYPGGYAQRFDGTTKGGDPQPAELQKIFQDNERTVKIRMEQEELPSLTINGAGNCGNFTAGHQFTLTRHFDANGPYVLTRVEHEARLTGTYRSGEESELEYKNDFTAIPAALPLRPLQETLRPTIDSIQTATVVGPAGEQIFCDKYGRVKVQFHWDRQGKNNTDSSCWLRVTQPWAGGNFGAITIPRIGQEVVIAFEEGDPDQPVILGGVYNAEQMPPFKLPDYRTYSALKTNSVHGKPSANFSGLAFNDKPGSEHTALYAEKDMLTNAENNHRHNVGNYQHTRIGHQSLTKVGSFPGIGGGSGGGGGDGSGSGGSNGTAHFRLGRNHDLRRQFARHRRLDASGHDWPGDANRHRPLLLRVWLSPQYPFRQPVEHRKRRGPVWQSAVVLGNQFPGLLWTQCKLYLRGSNKPAGGARPANESDGLLDSHPLPGV